jgi:hypothetical protein
MFASMGIEAINACIKYAYNESFKDEQNFSKMFLEVNNG